MHKRVLKNQLMQHHSYIGKSMSHALANIAVDD